MDEAPAKVKRVNMTPASAEASKLKFRNYTPRDPELKKFIIKKDSSEDTLLIKKQYLDRFTTLSTGSSVRTHRSPWRRDEMHFANRLL